MNKGIVRKAPNSANPNKAICNNDQCINPNKTLPNFPWTCPLGIRTVELAENMRQVAVSAVLPIGFTPRADVTTSVTGDVLPWGAFDIVIAITDANKNYEACMYKALIKDSSGNCSTSDLQDITYCNSSTQYCIKPYCTGQRRPSRPTPNKMACGRMGTFNLGNRYGRLVTASCGAQSPRQFSADVQIGYTFPHNCLQNGANQLDTEIKRAFQTANETWPGLCVADGTSCSNMQMTVTCNGTNAVAAININSLPEEFFKADGTRLSADDVLKLIILEENVFNIQGVLGSQQNKTESSVRTYPSCPQGNALLDDVCVECGAGTYYDPQSKTCMLCPIGQYQSLEGQMNCSFCQGTTTLYRGSRSQQQCIETCSPGTYYVPSSGCQKCPRDFYQDMENKDFCLPCEPGKRTRDNGTISKDKCFDDCLSGQELQESGNCTLCEQGTYRTQGVQDKCVHCDPGTTTTRIGAKAKTDCNIPSCQPGQHINGSDCLNCTHGTYQPLKWQYSCLKCYQNHTTRDEGATNASQCQFFCPDGYEIKSADNKTCSICPRGKYRQNSAGDGMFRPCERCPGGNTTEMDGAVEPVQCDIPMCAAGQIVSTDKSSCMHCPLDKYQPVPLPTSQTTCTQCRDGFGTLTNGSTSEADCKPTCPGGKQYNWTSSQCELCPQGYFKVDSDRFGNCTICNENFTTEGLGATLSTNCSLRDCPPGYKIVGNDCEICPTGTYQPNRRQYSCLDCGEQKNTSNPGQTSQNSCQLYCTPGYEGGNNNCTLCQEDHYKPNAGYNPCQSCAGTNFTSDLSRTGCNVLFCDVGNGFVRADNSCVPCSQGFYKDQRGNTECIACPQNFTTSGTAATSKNQCNQHFCAAGFYFDGSTCAPCQLGTFKSVDGNMACSNCSQNTTTPTEASISQDNCTIVVCEAGQYRSADNTCQKCPLRQYQTSRGAENCTPCPVRHTTLQTGSISESQCLILCDAGFFRNSSNLCEPCAVGTYQAETGKDMCVNCSQNFTTTGTGSTRTVDCHIVCEPGSKRTSRDACTKCPVGEYQPASGQTQCLKCGHQYTTLREGATDNSTDCYPDCGPGQYVNITTYQCIECDLGYYKVGGPTNEECTACPPTKTTSTKGSTHLSNCSVDDCQPGYKRGAGAQGCKPCGIGYYQPQKSQTSCIPCQNGYTTWIDNAISQDLCILDCGNGHQYDMDTRRCTPCQIGFYKDRAKNQTFCVKCPSGQTTPSVGQSACVNDPRPTSDPTIPTELGTFILKYQFNVVDCNSTFIENVIQNVLRKAVDRLIQIYKICPDNTCQSMTFAFSTTVANCRIKRQRRSTIPVIVTTTIPNIPQTVTGTNNQTRSTASVLRGMLYNPQPLMTQAEPFGITYGSLQSVTSELSCSAGNQLNADKSQCVPCGPGTYSNTGGGSCVQCPMNHYQNLTAQTSCIKCPPMLKTTRIGSTTCIKTCEESGYCQHGGSCSAQGDGMKCDCLENYEGDRCEKRKAYSSSTTTIIAASVGGGAGFLCLILLIVGIIVCQKKPGSEKKKIYQNGELNDYSESHLTAPYNGWSPFPPKDSHHFHVNPMFAEETMDFYNNHDSISEDQHPLSDFYNHHRSTSEAQPPFRYST